MKKTILNSIKKNLQGFMLVELAIVLVIIGLLITAFLPPLNAQRELSERRETQGILVETKEALIGYAVVSGHLPCPDADPIPNGIEDRKADGSCQIDEGTLPWNTLGIESTDSWSRYLRYRADTTFSNSNIKFSISNATGASNIQIIGENNLLLVSGSSRPAAVVVSFGSNGYGGINTNQLPALNTTPAPKGADEIENADKDVTFVSHVPTPLGSVNEFDDMLIWISPKVLITKMVTAGRLP